MTIDHAEINIIETNVNHSADIITPKKSIISIR
jgi:hypothetical protein